MLDSTRSAVRSPSLSSVAAPPAASSAAKPAPAATSKPVDKMDAAAKVTAPKPRPPESSISFDVNPQLSEIQQYAKDQGWTDQGFTQLSVPWKDLIYTTDNWKTTKVLHSYDVPSPFVNVRINLPGVKPGTPVEFAFHVGVACSSPNDIGGYRERGDVWLNNGGKNYTQTTAK